jgi:MoaA/NifB/PqqE/SkfB family radical SAM enzyme
VNIADVAELSFAGLKRSLQERAFLQKRRGLPRPSAVRVTLTERCNYRCQYCFHWRRERYKPELSLEEWKAIISDLHEYIGPFPVQFLGGEPMIWPGFVQLVQHCSSLGMRWGVISNGSALSRKSVPAIVAARPSNIDISLDASDPAIHDLARGVDGSHRHIVDGVMRLVAARAAAKQRFPIRIKTTFHRLNAGHLVELVEWVRRHPRMSIDFSPVRLWPSVERDKLYIQTEEDHAKLDETLRALVTLKTAGAPIETSVDKLLGIADHFRGKHVFHAYRECRVGLRTLDIGADGSARHCERFSIGNLTSHSIAELWESELRKKQIEETLVCEMAGGNECGTACTAYRSLRQEASRAWLFLKS